MTDLYAYCDQPHPAGDAEARDWCQRYHRPQGPRELETYRVRVCRDCGAEYATPGLTSAHKRATGHDGGFRTVTRTREKAPTRISYQPGYGPAE